MKAIRLKDGIIKKNGKRKKFRRYISEDGTISWVFD